MQRSEGAGPAQWRAPLGSPMPPRFRLDFAHRSLTCSLLLALCGTGCQQAAHHETAAPTSLTPSAPGKHDPGVTAICTPAATLMVGPYRYTNDQWGSKKATAPFEQCLLKRAGSTGSQLGWTWNWPGLDLTVFAYPSITFGWKPWVGGPSTDPRLPVRVADLERLDLSYAIESRAQGTYNLAAEIWFTRARPATPEADPESITRELMVWLEAEGSATPAGSLVSTPTVGDVPYELWKADGIGKEANGVGWTILTFKSPSTRHRGTLPLHEFVRHLVEHSLLSPDEYVASVEFGNEVMGGQGTTWIHRLEVELEP